MLKRARQTLEEHHVAFTAPHTCLDIQQKVHMRFIFITPTMYGLGWMFTKRIRSTHIWKFTETGLG